MHQEPLGYPRNVSDDGHGRFFKLPVSGRLQSVRGMLPAVALGLALTLRSSSSAAAEATSAPQPLPPAPAGKTGSHDLNVISDLRRPFGLTTLSTRTFTPVDRSSPLWGAVMKFITMTRAVYSAQAAAGANEMQLAAANYNAKLAIATLALALDLLPQPGAHSVPNRINLSSITPRIAQRLLDAGIYWRVDQRPLPTSRGDVWAFWAEVHVVTQSVQAAIPRVALGGGVFFSVRRPCTYYVVEQPLVQNFYLEAERNGQLTMGRALPPDEFLLFPQAIRTIAASYGISEDLLGRASAINEAGNLGGYLALSELFPKAIAADPELEEKTIQALGSDVANLSLAEIIETISDLATIRDGRLPVRVLLPMLLNLVPPTDAGASGTRRLVVAAADHEGYRLSRYAAAKALDELYENYSPSAAKRAPEKDAAASGGEPSIAAKAAAVLEHLELHPHCDAAMQQTIERTFDHYLARILKPMNEALARAAGTEPTP